MQIRFTNHARFRIEERGIGFDKARTVIRDPDELKPAFGNAMIAKKTFNGKIIEVVYRKSGGAILVITVYYQ